MQNNETRKGRFSVGMFLVTIGIVYGDIGTSPLYVMKSILEGNGGLAAVAVKMKKPAAVVLFIITFVCCMGMGYLSSQDFAKASMNWIAEGINVVGQGALLAGALMLHKAGLKEFTL